jgi:hypothetical protein
MLLSRAAPAAVVTWLLALPSGVALVRLLDPNPLTVEGVAAPLVGGFLVGLALLIAATRLRSPAFIGVVAGLYAAWCGTVIATALNGTPFGYNIMGGDAGRMSAMAMHFSETWRNVDLADPDLPAEYPPLYPMLIGRIAVVLGQPAWTLLGWAQVVVMSAAILAGFLIWNRLVSPGLALVLAAVVTVAWAEPSKANEVFQLAVLLPTILITFAPLPEGIRRLHPVVSGLVFGLTVPWWPSHLVLSLAGIACLMVLGWRAACDRRAYALRSAATVGVATVVSSWFTVPLLIAYLTQPTQVVADQFISASHALNPIVVFFGAAPSQALVAIGIIGIVALWRLTWWARPLGVYLVALFAVQGLMFARMLETQHTFLLPYVKPLLHYSLLAAGLLTLGYLWDDGLRPRLVRTAVPVRALGVVLVAGVLASTAAHAWAFWMPAPRGAQNAMTAPSGEANSAYYPHTEYLPDGTRPRFATSAEGIFWFPADPIDVLIEEHASVDDPRVLSYDQRLFSFHPHLNWLPPDRTSASSLIRWDDRYAELSRLASISSPERFAAESARSAFGPIDVFVLVDAGDEWRWGDITFRPSQFDSGFTVIRDVPGDIVVAIRDEAS